MRKQPVTDLGEDAMTAVDGSTRSGPPAEETAFLTELAGALDRIAAGDLKVRLRHRGGPAGEVVERLNQLVEVQQRSTRDILRISRIVGREGRMTERLDEEGYEGG